MWELGELCESVFDVHYRHIKAPNIKHCDLSQCVYGYKQYTMFSKR